MLTIAAYNEAIKSRFSSFKGITDPDTLRSRIIPIPAHGTLIPVCRYHLGDSEMIAQLAKWRDENASFFPSQFLVTHEGTSLWLKRNLLDIEDRILFIVCDREGQLVGHLGYANCLNVACEMEIDNVVRGAKSVQPGLMSQAMRTLLLWARESFEPKAIYLRVMSHNDHAIAFYRKLGFHDERLLPLRRREENGYSSLSPLDPGDHGVPDRYYMRMILRS